MAKKTNKKRKQRKTNVPVYSVPVESQDNEAAAATVAAQAPTSNPLAGKNATTTSIDWAKEYPFYAPDMRKLGIVVALMVILLLALNMLFIYVL
jgi:outer membrane biosynthesis protein TonB